MNVLDEVNRILESREGKKRKLLKKEQWMIEEVHPFFTHKFPNIKSEKDLDDFLSWAGKRKFSKKELQIIKMARETVLPDHYHTIWTVEDLDEFAEWLDSLDMVAIDTETTGLNKYKEEIVGISFYAPHKGYYIPLKHIEDIRHNEDEYNDHIKMTNPKIGVDFVSCLPVDLVVRRIGPILAKDSLKQIYHNYLYDYHIIRRFLGVKVNCYFDTMVGQALLDENHSKGLKEMSETYLKVPADSYSTLFGKVTFDRPPILLNEKDRTGNIATYYATKDTELTYKMYEFQIKHLNSPSLVNLYNIMFDIEMPFLHMVAETEARGVMLDSDYLLSEVKPVLAGELKELKDKIEHYIGDINLNSPKQLSEALYKGLKLPQVNKKKPKSTDKATMNKLKPYHEVIATIMEYRRKSKLMDTFVEKLPLEVIDGRVHTSFSTVKKTGRMSSSGPNLQQIPSYTNLIRNAFVADEGRLFASLDFGSQELRILTEVSDDDVMFKIFTEGGDAHSTTAVTIWNNTYPDMRVDIDTFQRLRKVSDFFRDKNGDIDYEKIDDIHIDQAIKDGILLSRNRDDIIKEVELGKEYGKFRNRAKTTNFAIVYGTTSMGLSDTLEVSEEEAQSYIDAYMETYPGVAKWIKETQQEIKSKTYVETILGRKRRFYSEVNSGQRWLLEAAYRQGTNFKIQASAAEMTKKASLDMREILKKHGINIALWIHDELLLDIPEDLGMDPLREIADIMCKAIPLKCGMTSDIEISKRWGQRMSSEDIIEYFGEEE